MDSQKNVLASTFGTQKRWVNYKLVPKVSGGFDKIPQTITGANASTTDGSTWSTYDEAAKNSAQVGIVFTPDQLLLGIDIDHCLHFGKIEHPESEKVNQLIGEANTYTEVSPSGTGLHLFLSLSAPLKLEANRKDNFEAYTSGRFFTVTNNPHGEVLPVRAVTPQEADYLLSIIGYPWNKKKIVESQMLPIAVSFGDTTVMAKIFASNKGGKIKGIYNGNLNAYDGDESRADMALCAHLAYWTSGNVEQMERLWLASPLGQRNKTQNRKDYRDRTISNAIKGCKEVYSPVAVPITRNEIAPTIDVVGEMLKQIPPETPPTKLMGVLGHVFEALIEIDKLTAEAFITNDVKEHFGITKEDARKYIPYLNGLRIKSYKKAKEEEKIANRLPLITDRDIHSQEAYGAVCDIGIVNEDTFKIITAIIVSARLRLNPPLWLFLIGVPSSFKTELVGLFDALEDVYTLDTLSENAFSSGYVPPDGSEPQDLLPQLDNKAFIIKDLNTLFSMNEELVKKILGDLTSIFDGKFQKFTATRGMVEYNSLFSMIGCVTPSIMNKHYNYATQLGPRFFFLRVPELTEEEMNLAFEKSWDEKDRGGKIMKARQIVSSYAAQLIARLGKQEKTTPAKEIQAKINNVARFICKARGIAITGKSSFKNDKNENVEYYEIKDWQVEHPWRILNQLKSLLSILSFINGNPSIGEEELEIIRPIVLSTMPVDRAEILNVLASECGMSNKDLSQRIGKSSKTIQRTMKELEALKIIDSYKDPKYNISGKAPWMHFIRGEFASVLNAPMPTPESLSQLKSMTSETGSEDEEDDSGSVQSGLVITVPALTVNSVQF